MSETVVVLAQMNCRLHDKEANLRRMRKIVTGSKGDVVIFPELNLTGYMPRDDMFKLAETEEGPYVRKVVSLAKDTGKDVVFGLPMKDGRAHGHIYNSCLMATGDGRLFRYDKMYLPTFGPFEERLFFTVGSNPVVAEGLHARLGLTVCYDMFFPELVKLEALRGAQVIVNISAAPTTSRNSFERVMPARAVENGVFVAYVNMVGVHGSLVFGGGSVVYDPRGEPMAMAKYLKEDIVAARIDLADLEVVRRFRPLGRDVRPEVIEGLRSELMLRRGGAQGD